MIIIISDKNLQNGGKYKHKLPNMQNYFNIKNIKFKKYI